MLITWLFPILLTLGLLLLSWGARQWSWFAWGLVPAFGLPFVVLAVLGYIEITPFTWAKVVTLLVVIGVFNAYRFTPLANTKVGGWMIWLLLAVNIAEAVAQDWGDGFWLRGAVGVGLILTQGGIAQISRTGPRRDLAWKLPIPWILAYTAWNLSFAMRFYDLHTTDHVSHLGVPLIFMLVLPNSWLQIRGYALAIYALLIVGWVSGLGLPWPEPIFWATPAIYTPVTITAALLLTWHVAGRLGIVPSPTRVPDLGWGAASK